MGEQTMNHRVMGKRRVIVLGLLGLLILSVFLPMIVLGSGPKSIYGTIYVGGQKAAAEIDVKIKIDNQTFGKKTFTWNQYNYIIGLPPGYEGKTAYFFVGRDNAVPIDNSSFVISASIEYIYDLHVGNLTPNIAPTAFIDSITPNPAAYNWTVRFIGHGTDPDGNITAYQWHSSITGNLSMNKTFNLSSMQKGNHTIYFKVRDNKNTWSPEISQVLRITHYNRIPKATIDWVRPQRVRVDSNVSFKGHGNDSDGIVVGYSWRSNRSGVFGSKASFNYSELPKGNHTIYLKVMDNTSYWSDEVQTWLLILPNMPPTARILGPSQAEVGVPIQFDGTSSTDSDGKIRAWFWEFGDGTNSTASQPTHSFNEIKTYTVRLTVTDDSGAKANTSAQVTIDEASSSVINTPPGKATIKGPKKGSVGTNYTFSFTASDPDFDEIYFSVQWGDGKATTTQFTSSNQPISVEHTWEKAGRYTINVTTLDLNYGSSGIQTFEIVISDAFLGGIDSYFLVIPIIIVIAVVLAIFLLRRRRASQQNPTPMVMDAAPAEDYPYYTDQPIESEPATIPLAQPMERPSSFKRI